MYRQLYQMGGMGIESLSPMQPAMQPAMQSAMYTPLENTYYSGMPMMMAGGGIANLVDREKYGIGSKVKRALKSAARTFIPKELDPVLKIAAPFLGPVYGPIASIAGSARTGKINPFSLAAATLPYLQFDPNATGLGSLMPVGYGGSQYGIFGGANVGFGTTQGTTSLSQMIGDKAKEFLSPNTPTQNLIKGSPDVSGAEKFYTDAGKYGFSDPEFADLGTNREIGQLYSEDFLKNAPEFKPISTTGPTYGELIKKAGSLENVSLSERFNAVKDLSTKALTDIYTKPIINPKTGETTNVLDKTALFATFAGASSYLEARKLADKAGVPESEFSEADYQRLKVEPEKKKYTDVLKPESFGIRPQSANGGLMDGVLSIKLTPAQAMAMGGIISERDNYGLGSIVKKISSTIKSVVNPQTQVQSPRLASANPVNDLYKYYLENETDEEYKKRIMESINPRFDIAMAKGGRIGYQEGTKPGFTPPSKPSLVEDFYKSSFYDPKAMGHMALVPVTLPTGEKFTFSGGADSAGFKEYVKSLGYSINRGDGLGYNVIAPTPVPSPTVPAPTMPTPGLTAPIVETPISVAEQVQQFIGKGTPAVNEEFIINRRRQAEQDAAARVTPGITPIITPPTFSIPTSPSMNATEYKLPVEQIPYINNPIYQNFLQSPFYNPMTPGLTVVTPVQLPTGEFLDLPDSATANQFRQYLSSTPAGGAPVQSNSQSFTLPNIYKTGGRVNYFMGSEIPVRQNQGGVKELDLRNKGGFIPVGIKEKADDVPAMLSRNEFVFTADAVRGAGGGSINKGAQKMYKLMKSLEKKVKKMKKVA